MSGAPRCSASSLPTVTFWPSLLVELLGGLATGLVVAAVLRLGEAMSQVDEHDRLVREIREDIRRFIRDRDRELSGELRALHDDLAGRGMLYSGARVAGVRIKRARALHDYRDEISRKRRSYAALVEREGWAHEYARLYRDRPALPLRLEDEQLEILAKWRAPVEIHGLDTVQVQDPTSEELEPDLRRFEREGDHFRRRLAPS